MEHDGYEVTIVWTGEEWQAELFRVDESGESGDCLGVTTGTSPQGALYELAISRVAVYWED